MNTQNYKFESVFERAQVRDSNCPCLTYQCKLYRLDTIQNHEQTLDIITAIVLAALFVGSLILVPDCLPDDKQDRPKIKRKGVAKASQARDSGRIADGWPRPPISHRRDGTIKVGLVDAYGNNYKK